MAKQEVFEVLQALGGSATVHEILTYQLEQGKDVTRMTVWQDLIKLMKEKRVKMGKHVKGRRITNVFTITGKSAPRNVVVLNGDGTIAKRIA